VAAALAHTRVVGNWQHLSTKPKKQTLCPTSGTSQTSRKSLAGKVKAEFTKPVERRKR